MTLIQANDNDDMDIHVQAVEDLSDLDWDEDDDMYESDSGTRFQFLFISDSFISSSR